METEGPPSEATPENVVKWFDLNPSRTDQIVFFILVLPRFLNIHAMWDALESSVLGNSNMDGLISIQRNSHTDSHWTTCGSIVFIRLWIEYAFDRDFLIVEGNNKTLFHKVIRLTRKLTIPISNRFKLLILKHYAKTESLKKSPRSSRRWTQTYAYTKAAESLKSPSMNNINFGSLKGSSERHTDPFSLFLKDHDPFIFAEQIAIYHNKLIKNMTVRELLSQKETEGSKRNMIMSFNALSGWVADQILSEIDVESRAKVLSRALDVLEACKRLNNYHGMMAIIAALSRFVVSRLSVTWELIPERKKQILQECEAMMSPNNNFIAYRKALKIEQPPIVPYLGIATRDLTFANEIEETINGNPNFSKMLTLGSLLHDLMSYRDHKYEIEENMQLQRLLEYMPIYSEDSLYAKSYLCQPLK